jgi:hypothetical protein
MMGSLWTNVKSGALRVTRQACLVAGIALVVVATSWILVPLALGLVLLAAAKWAADREVNEAPMIVVPVRA